MRTFLLSVTLAACLAFAAAEDENAAAEARQSIDGADTTYVILSGGDGAAVAKGNKVTVHAKGKTGGSTFWNTRDTNQPFTYSAGTGSVIKGWDKGVLGMQIGELRHLYIPAHEGYGSRGLSAWKIPGNADLEFEIEVIKIN